MPVFSYSILIGVEEKNQKYVNAELMISIVKSKTQDSYAEYLSSEMDMWNDEGKLVFVTDNKYSAGFTFEGIGLKSYCSDLGEIEHLDPEIDFDLPEEIFSKSFRFKDAQKYYEFASGSNINSFYRTEMYSNPDRYFMWTVE